MRVLYTLLSALCIAVGLSGCELPVLACSDDLGMKLTPSERTILVGESFTPSVTLSTCGGQRRITDSFTWAAEDLAVVSVDPRTGRTTGKTPGQTLIWPTGQRYGRLSAIQVTVRAGS